MKKVILGFLMVFFLCGGMFADTITIVADPWEPYTGAEPDSDKPGYLIEIAIAIFEKAGHEVEYKLLPWSRAIISSRDGNYNAIAGSFSSDAPDFIFPENPQGISETVFFTLKGRNWRYSGISSLSSQVLGIIRDYSYGEDIDTYVEQNKNNVRRVLIASGDDALAINEKRLSAGRITTLMEDRAVFSAFLNEIGKGDTVRDAGSLEGENVYITFSPAFPKSKEYAEILSKGMVTIRRSGELKRILDRYGLEDWE